MMSATGRTSSRRSASPALTKWPLSNTWNKSSHVHKLRKHAVRMVAKQKFLNIDWLSSHKRWTGHHSALAQEPAPHRDLKINLSLYICTSMHWRKTWVDCLTVSIYMHNGRAGPAIGPLPLGSGKDSSLLHTAWSIKVHFCFSYIYISFGHPTDLRQCSKLLIPREDNETSFDNGMSGQWWRFMSE